MVPTPRINPPQVCHLLEFIRANKSAARFVDATTSRVEIAYEHKWLIYPVSCGFDKRTPEPSLRASIRVNLSNRGRNMQRTNAEAVSREVNVQPTRRILVRDRATIANF